MAIKLRIVTPRSRKVAALDQFQRRASKPAPRTVAGRPSRKRRGFATGVLAPRPSSEYASNGVGWVGELSLEPAIKSHLEQWPRGVFRRDFEQRIDAGFDRAFAQQVCAERMNGSDPRLFELRQRVVQKRLLVRRSVRRLALAFDLGAQS